MECTDSLAMHLSFSIYTGIVHQLQGTSKQALGKQPASPDGNRSQLPSVLQVSKKNDNNLYLRERERERERSVVAITGIQEVIIARQV